jgi:hypothetical protein
MCRRAVEAVCAQFIERPKRPGNLDTSLRQLLEKKVIDERIYEWSNALRKHGNIGAHATDEKVSRDDAKDVLSFAEAIAEYVIVLNKKFRDFMSRKKTNSRDKGEAGLDDSSEDGEAPVA